jgi:hypothetical protein
MSFTEQVKKRRADFWAALTDGGDQGVEALLNFYWWWARDTADSYFDKFVAAGLSPEELEAEKQNALGIMRTTLRHDVTQLPRLPKREQRDLEMLAATDIDTAFEGRLAERLVKPDG